MATITSTGNIEPTNVVQVWGWNSTEAIGWDNNTIISLSTHIPAATGSIKPT